MEYVSNIKKLTKIAFPIYLNYIVTIVFSIFDQAIAGHLGDISFIAVSSIYSIFYFVIGALGAVSPAYIVIRKDKDSDFFNKVFTFSLIFTGIIVIIVNMFPTQILKLLIAYDYEVYRVAKGYIRVISPLLIFNVLIFILNAELRFNNRNYKIIFVSIISLTINLVLSTVLSYGLFGVKNYGAIGTGIGSTIATFIELMILVCILKKEKLVTYKLDFGFNKLNDFYKEVAKFFTQEFFEYTLLSIVVLRQVSKIGIIDLGVYNFLNSIFIICMLFYYSIGKSIIILNSQEKNSFSILDNLKTILIMVGIYSLVIFILLMGHNNFSVVNLMNSSKDITNGFKNIILFYILYQAILGINEILFSYLNSIGKSLYVTKLKVILSISICVLVSFLNKSVVQILGIIIILNIVTLMFVFIKFKNLKRHNNNLNNKNY